jgi:hypothetical protein
MSSSVTWCAWGLAGAFFTLVALPLASSSPYPTPSRPEWSEAPVQMAMASASGFALASASSTPVSAETVVRLVTPVKTLSIRRPIGDEPDAELERPIVTASLGKYQAREPGYEQQLAAAPSMDDAAPVETQPPTPPRTRPTADQVTEYLWEVYQRQPVKKDRGGDFSWKDPAAANRMGKTLQAYVIAGMDTDFRELIYHAGKAMDAAGVEWTIVSGFRDDWRQSIASGLKARTGFSRHGGSQAVGGYGHGLAIDIGHVDNNRSHEVFRWIDNNGAKFGLHRPYRFDPPHVEPRLDWRRLAIKLRDGRTGGVETAEAETNDAVEASRPAAKRKVRNARNVRYASARGNRPARKRHN